MALTNRLNCRPIQLALFRYHRHGRTSNVTGICTFQDSSEMITMAFQSLHSKPLDAFKGRKLVEKFSLEYDQFLVVFGSSITKG